jgi:hypothetical protein
MAAMILNEEFVVVKRGFKVKCNKVWSDLREVIGHNITVKAEYQMTATGLKLIGKEVMEYHGPMSYANAGGRPILTPDYLTTHTVGVAGQQDVIWNPLYDSISYPSAGQLLFSFFANPQGQGTSSTPGAGAVAKSIYDTNLQIGNQLTAGNEFYMIGSESLFFPGVSNAALPSTVLPGAVITDATAGSIGAFINDIWSIGVGGIKTLTVGTDRKYIQDGPLNMFPPATRLAAVAALAGAGSSTTGTGVAISYAAWSGEIYTVVPIYLQSNQNWTMTVAFSTLIPTSSTQIGRLQDRMRGYLVRQAT